MNLTWHIVMKDARRLWLPLVVWAVLIAVHRHAEWNLAHTVSDDAAWLMRKKYFVNFYFVMHLLAGYVLVAAMMLEDPPMGTSTFWLTRPISGARLLGAKVVAGVALFVVLPALISLPWLIASAPDGGSSLAAIWAVLRWQVWVIAPAMVIATFTGGLGKFLGWTLGLCPAVAVVLLTRHLDGWPLSGGFLFGREFRHMAETPAWTIVLLGCGAAMFLQYQTPRKRAALALAVVSAFAGVVIAITVSSPR